MNKNLILTSDFKVLFESSPIATAIVTLSDGIFVEVNHAFLSFYGYSYEEVIGQTSDELRLWNNDVEREKIVTILNEQGQIKNFPYEYNCKSGKILKALFSANVIHLNNTPYLLGCLAEINEFDETQQVGNINNQAIFDSMLNGMAHCRMFFKDGQPIDFVYLQVNKAFEEQTGLQNVVGKKVSQIIPKIRESDSRLFEIYGRVATSGKPECFEIYLASLQHWFLISVFSPRQDEFIAILGKTLGRYQNFHND